MNPRKLLGSIAAIILVLSAPGADLPQARAGVRGRGTQGGSSTPKATIGGIRVLGSDGLAPIKGCPLNQGPQLGLPGIKPLPTSNGITALPSAGETISIRRDDHALANPQAGTIGGSLNAKVGLIGQAIAAGDIYQAASGIQGLFGENPVRMSLSGPDGSTPRAERSGKRRGVPRSKAGQRPSGTIPSWLDRQSLIIVEAVERPGIGGSNITIRLQDKDKNVVTFVKPSPAPPIITRTPKVTFSPILHVRAVESYEITGDNAGELLQLLYEVQERESYRRLTKNSKAAVKNFLTRVEARFVKAPETASPLFGGAKVLKALNGAVREVLAPYNDRSAMAAVEFTKVKTNDTRAVDLALTVDYSKTKPAADDKIADGVSVKIRKLVYSYPEKPSALPKGSIDAELKVDMLAHVASQEDFNTLGPRADRLVQDMIEQWTRDYGEAAKIDARVTKKVTDEEGNLKRLKLVLSVEGDLSKLPPGVDVRDVWAVSVKAVLTVTTKGLRVAGDVVFNPLAKQFQRDGRGLKELLDKLLARDPEQIREIQRTIKNIDGLATGLLDRDIPRPPVAQPQKAGHQVKINPRLQSQLDALAPGQTVTALIRVNAPELAFPPQMPREERLKKMRELYREHSKSIRDYLRAAGVETKERGSLGIIIVQVNKKHVEALGELPAVKAIIGNQPVDLIQ